MKFISITPENENSAEFIEIISKMPAFVKLYSPGCGHCVAMQDAWDALKGNAALKNYDMAIIEVHADELDKITSPAMSVNQGFPTIRKVLKRGNLGKDYNGDRSTADMIKFIKENFQETHKSKHSKSKHSKSKHSKSKHSKSKHSKNKYMKGGKKQTRHRNTKRCKQIKTKKGKLSQRK